MTAQTTHHICFSQTHAMTSLTFVSLLLLTAMVSTASAQGGIGSCCRRITATKVTREMLRSYYVQDQPSCHLHAVVFTTQSGKRICAAPGKMWTETSKAFLDGKAWHLQHKTPHTQHH